MSSVIPFALRSAKNFILNPIVPASALIFIAYAPQDVVERVFNPETLQRVFGISDIRNSLRILLAIGFTRFLNKFFSRLALNNWSRSPQAGWKWQEELAVVTGGCNGIGRAIALGLVEKGVRVAVLDVQDLPADMAKISTIKYWKCDITSDEAVNEVADEIRLTMGHPTILVNNAGMAKRASILEAQPEDVKKVIGVNLMSLWFTTKAFLPNMVLKNKGHIVTIASVASYVTLPGAISYSATKAGALAFDEGLKAEIRNIYKAPGVVSTVVHPFWVATNMTAPFSKEIVGSSGPMMKPEDISNAVLKQIYSRKGSQLFVPEDKSTLSFMRVLPSWVQHGILDAVSRGRFA